MTWSPFAVARVGKENEKEIREKESEIWIRRGGVRQSKRDSVAD
jgi:hypothetical protein